MPFKWELDIGSTVLGNGDVRFKVWAPLVDNVSVKIVSAGKTSYAPLSKSPSGYHDGVGKASKGDLYLYKLDGGAEYPDPASRFQPDGVHGPSEIIDPNDFKWEDHKWKRPHIGDYVIYELHIGTFTNEGTFESVISSLDYLKELGVTAVEIMPVSQFPGGRNWGYDGVFPFAPQNSYGGPKGFKTLINACHLKGIAVILDVVYNHLGPEGNYLGQYGYYFTDRYKTPWGAALNFDGPMSDETRRFFVQNTLYWITEYHMDALRVDAIHGIFDFGAIGFLEELTTAVHSASGELGGNIFILAESDLNDSKTVRDIQAGGCGFDAQWNDDFHHSLHCLLTGEQKGYYIDFGDVEHMGKALREGFVYSGQYSVFRQRRHGSPSSDIPPSCFVVSSQNHDQVGNRMKGDRLTSLLTPEQLKLAAGVTMLSPYIPLLFMGEEYGETAPFMYFTSHFDPDLVEAVRKGRMEEFSSFGWDADVPDPQSEQTFLGSKLDPSLRFKNLHAALFDFYKTIIHIRKTIPSLGILPRENIEATVLKEEKTIALKRYIDNSLSICVFNFSPSDINLILPTEKCRLLRVFDSSSTKWSGDSEVKTNITQLNVEKMQISLKPYSFKAYILERTHG